MTIQVTFVRNGQKMPLAVQAVPRVGESVEIPGWPKGSEQSSFRVSAVDHLCNGSTHVIHVTLD